MSRRWMCVWAAVELLLVAVATGQVLESEYRKKGEQVREAFEPVRAVLQTSSAVLYDGRLAKGYGVVMTEDGLIMAKASEVSKMEDLSVRVDRKSFKEVSLLGSDQRWDVILLKVDAEGLVPVELVEEEVSRGTLVFSNSGTSRLKRRAQMGIVSATPRRIDGPSLAVLGVAMMEDAANGGIGIEKVFENSGAEKAGIQEKDVILALDGEPVKTLEQIAETLASKLPGDRMSLRLKRGEEEVEVSLELSARGDVFEEQFDRNDMMSGEFSERRTNFPMVMQHDTPMAKRTIGGPLLNLEGKCLGMNIAFATREATYAIPAKELREVFADLSE